MPSNEAIERIRSRFNDQLKTNSSLYHQVDIERVKNEEWQIKRFLIEYEDDENKAFENLIKALQWKKEFGLHERNDQYFPKELWELNGVEVNGRDKEDRVIQWEVYKNQKSFKETTLLAQQFIAHNVERVDRAAGEKGCTLVMDTNGAGISNVNLDLTKFKLNIINHYPGMLKQLLVVDLPWLLNSIMKIIVSLMSPKLREMVVYVKKQDLPQYMDQTVIPVSLSGKRDKQAFPQELIPLDQLMEPLGLQEKFVNEFYNSYKLKRTNK